MDICTNPKDLPPCSCCKRRLVLAYDGSEHSKHAMKWLVDALYQEGDHLYVYHAFEWPAMPATTYTYGFGYFEEWESVRRQVEDEAHQILCECRAMMKQLISPRKCEHVEFILDGGVRPGEGICHLSKRLQADLIAAGSRGLGTVRRTILGSVSDYIVHHAHIPVAVIPPPRTSSATQCQQKQQ